jgi:hypothetical protein
MACPQASGSHQPRAEVLAIGAALPRWQWRGRRRRACMHARGKRPQACCSVEEGGRERGTVGPKG